jgi:hypothetical protein
MEKTGSTWSCFRGMPKGASPTYRTDSGVPHITERWVRGKDHVEDPHPPRSGGDLSFPVMEWDGI